MRDGEPSQRMKISQAQKQTRTSYRPLPQSVKTKKARTPASSNSIPIDSGLSDFFLVTSATNDRQAVAIADEIELRLKREFGVYPNSVEGRRKGEWILLDYVDFVVHVFLAERRAFYDIERLRKSARPLTPAEFDAELKAALAEKTRAARKKSAPVHKPKTTPARPASKTAPAKKRPAARRTAAKKAKPVRKTAPKRKK